MGYATGADGTLKGMESSEARAITSQSTDDHKDNDKASKATTQHGNAQDNQSPRWKEEDRTTRWGEPHRNAKAQE